MYDELNQHIHDIKWNTFNIDKPAKSPKFRHACEGRYPELPENTEFPPSRE